MAAVAHWYGLGLKHALTDVNLATATIYMALFPSSYVPNQDTDEFYSAISSQEVAGTGYTAGGQAISGVAVGYDTTNNRVSLSFSPVAWPTSTLTARIAVLYVHTGTPSTSALLGWLDAGANQVSSAGTQTVNGDGGFQLRAAAA